MLYYDINLSARFRIPENQYRVKTKDCYKGTIMPFTQVSDGCF